VEEIPGIIHVLHPLIKLLVKIDGREGNKDFAVSVIARWRSALHVWQRRKKSRKESK
jgi:hypothetical protein